MHDVLEQVDNFLNEPVEEDDKQEIFNRVSNFILQLEPDSLSDDQLDEVVAKETSKISKEIFS